jgi:hypothetical protein
MDFSILKVRHYDPSKRRICQSTRRSNPEDLNLYNKLQGIPCPGRGSEWSLSESKSEVCRSKQLAQWGAHFVSCTHMRTTSLLELMSRTYTGWRGEGRDKMVAPLSRHLFWIRYSVIVVKRHRNTHTHTHHLAARQNTTVKLWKDVIFWHFFMPKKKAAERIITRMKKI